MRLICPECKNEVDLTNYSDINAGSVVECNHCGITLEISEVGENVVAQVMDEGK